MTPMIFELNRDCHIPLYAQITAHIRGMIADGVLKIGDRLPANRELAKMLGVNRTTVNTAYAELYADGLIDSHVGRGTFIQGIPAPARGAAQRPSAQPSPIQWNVLVSDQKPDNWLSGMPNVPVNKDVVSLAYSLPSPDLFPLDQFRHALDHALRKEGRALIDSGCAFGYQPLIEYVAAQSSLSGRTVKTGQVVITSGCQQSLNLIRQLLIGPDDEVAIESPTYPGALSVFCPSGSKYIGVPVGPRGIDLDVLEEILTQRRPKLIYTTPSFHNPTGVTMDLAARRRLLDLAVKHKVPIVEDDIYGELRYQGPSLPSLKALDEHGVVIYINSFSKVGLPGIRVGWIVADSALVRHLAAAKRKADLHTSQLAQAAAYEFSRHGLLAKHIRRMKKVYGERRDVMLSALDKYFPDESAGTTWTKPEGGMAIWVTLPEGINASQILLESIEKGVVFSPGEHFYPNLSPANSFRLSFTTVGPQAIEDSIKRLGLVLKSRLTNVRKQYAAGGFGPLRALV
jgi:2-aminoadipate transaminase